MSVHFFDIYAGIGLALMVVPFVAWFGIFYNHHKTLKVSGAWRIIANPLRCIILSTVQVGTERVQVLVVRNALFLPTYATLLWLSLVLPPLFPILEGPIAIAEGHHCKIMKN